MTVLTSEQRRLRRHHIEIRVDSRLVSRRLQLQGLFGRTCRLLLLQNLLRQQAHRSQRIFNLLKRCQHRLPVGCDSLLVNTFVLIERCRA